MLPCFGSAMAACTWHFFYNAPELEYLVALQVGAQVWGAVRWALRKLLQQSPGCAPPDV